MTTATTRINRVNYKFTLLIRFKTIAFIVGLLFHQSVTLEPDFAFPLQNVTVLEGQTVAFTCVINNLGNYRTAWIKPDTRTILAIHKHVIRRRHGISIKHNNFNTTTLIIQRIKMEDRGKYMCQVNTYPLIEQEAFLEVFVPPDIINEETSGDMMVPEGGSAKLVCKSRGFPKPKIVWSREDGHDIIVRNGSMGRIKSMSYEGEILWLSKVTRSEMGGYLCNASNDVPPAISKRINLQVHFHPHIQVLHQLVGAPVGTDVKLVCNVEASPKAINYWQRENGEMIISNHRYNMKENGTSMYAAQMVLHIVKLQKVDFGRYKCVSKNIIGDAEGTIRLYEIETMNKLKSNEDYRNSGEDNLSTFDENYEDNTLLNNVRVYKGVQSRENDSNAKSKLGSTNLSIIIYFIIFIINLYFYKL